MSFKRSHNSNLLSNIQDNDNDDDENDYEDYETLEDYNKQIKKKPDDFISLIINKAYEFDWLILLAIAIAYLFINLEIYDEFILNKVEGTKTPNGDITSYGYMIKLLSLLIGTLLSRFLFSIATY